MVSPASLHYFLSSSNSQSSFGRLYLCAITLSAAIQQLQLIEHEERTTAYLPTNCIFLKEVNKKKNDDCADSELTFSFDCIELIRMIWDDIRWFYTILYDLRWFWDEFSRFFNDFRWYYVITYDFYMISDDFTRFYTTLEDFEKNLVIFLWFQMILCDGTHSFSRNFMSQASWVCAQFPVGQLDYFWGWWACNGLNSYRLAVTITNKLRVECPFPSVHLIATNENSKIKD